MSAPVLQLQVRYFASLREALGTERETVATGANTAGTLRQALIARGGAYAEALAHDKAVRVAVNQTMAADEQTLADGDEVAFFPPVTGG